MVVVAGCCCFLSAGTHCQFVSSLSFTSLLKSSSAGLLSVYWCSSLDWYQGLSWTTENKWRRSLIKKKPKNPKNPVNLSTLLWKFFLSLSFYVVICWWKSETSLSLSLLYFSVLMEAAFVEVWTQMSFYLKNVLRRCSQSQIVCQLITVVPFYTWWVHTMNRWKNKECWW